MSYKDGYWKETINLQRIFYFKDLHYKKVLSLKEKPPTLPSTITEEVFDSWVTNNKAVYVPVNTKVINRD